MRVCRDGDGRIAFEDEEGEDGGENDEDDSFYYCYLFFTSVYSVLDIICNVVVNIEVDVVVFISFISGSRFVELKFYF